jgi:hypothetical protein
MRPSRETWLAIGLLTLLVIVTIVAAVSQARQGEGQLPPLASFSSAPGGARALRLWLEEIGYTVRDDVGETFAPPQDADVVLILEPTMPITDEEWETIDAWVKRGGALVLAGEGSWYWSSTSSAIRHYGLWLDYLTESNPVTLTAQTPLLASPPLTGTANARPTAYLQPGNNNDFVTHLAVGSQPVLISFVRGDGRVIICTAPFPFTNAGLKEKGNPELALNVVTAASRPSVSSRSAIWFDEWHHGVRPKSATAAGPEDWLRYTPSGHAMLYTAAVIFLALALTGRRFGRPVPLPKRTIRRTPLEYVTAIANLSRRAGHRQAVLRYHYQRLKRDLGKRYRLSPTLPDGEYAARLAEFNPNVDAVALRDLLARLRKKKTNESEMIQLAAEVAAWLKE